jgi:hypothetical protein
LSMLRSSVVPERGQPPTNTGRIVCVRGMTAA